MLTRTHISSLARPAVLFGIAAMIALPAQASAPGSQYVSAPIVQEIEPDVASAFTRFDALPDSPEPSGNVVDIDTIEPPIEIVEPVADTTSGRSLGRGIASYYGKRFHGRRTANGERFDMNALTAAHKKLPFGTRVRVINPNNGKSVVVRINDRGPYAHGRTIDLSRAAARKIGLVSRGHGSLKLEQL